jgi:6-phosphofructokinase 1
MTELGRVGILTGGGDAPGLNAALRAVVKTAQRLNWEVVGISDGFEGLLFPAIIRTLGPDDVRGIEARGGTILGASNRCNPFAYRFVEAGQVRTEDRSSLALENARKLGLDALIVVGGDGSLHLANRLWELGLPVVGVPKTIDNDISSTDQSFGFDTAVNVATEAIDRLQTTAESHHRVMIVEVMGRTAGWIALCAGLAGGGDIVLIPEIPFELERVRRRIDLRAEQARNFSMIVVAEGAAPLGGEQLTVEPNNPLSPKRLGGVGPWLAATLGPQTEREVRSMVLGHLQRGGSPTAFDRILATRLGAAAMEYVAEGRFGQMAALQGGNIVPVALEEAMVTRQVDPNGSLVRAARQIAICLGDAD